MPTPLEKFEQLLTFVDDPTWATRDVVEKILIISRDIPNAALRGYQQCRGDAAAQAELGQAIRESYAKWLAPIDIPGVGPIVEGVIDAQLPNILAGLVSQVDAFLDKKLPNPVPPV